MTVSAVLILVLVALGAGEAVKCNQWTNFYDRDDPPGNGDFEVLTSIKTENPNDYICTNPSALEAETLAGVPYYDTNDVVRIANDFTSFACVSDDQPPQKYCEDYKVRFCCLNIKPSCPKGYLWTPYYDTDRNSGDGDFEKLEDIRNSNPNEICERPMSIDVKDTTTGYDFRRYRENVELNPSLGFWCINKDQSDGSCRNYKVRFCCPRFRG